MSSQILLSGGDKYYSYSGEVFGDVSAPATIPMITIDNTGLRDSLIQLQTFFGLPISTSAANQLGLQIKLDNKVVVTQQGRQSTLDGVYDAYNLFVPRNSKLEVISINTSGNNTQIRGANVLGYYL